MMSEFGAGGDGEDDLIIDLEHMFDTVLPDTPDDDIFFLHRDDVDKSNSSSSTPPSFVATDPSPSAPLGASSFSMIEEFLLNDNHCDSVDHNHPQLLSAVDDFLSDILLDSPVSLQDSSAASSPRIDLHEAKDQQQQQEEANFGHRQLAPSQLHEDDGGLHEDKENPPNDIIDNDDADVDPLVKKRRRQLRNRDAAVRSRERKKMYVKDLEMKSRYYEAECKRLGMLLNCYLAENHALRLSLHNTNNTTPKAFDASTTTKQESAVLFLESLLLGSLLWFLGIIGLLILPIQLLSVLEAAGVENVGSKNQGNLAPREAESNVFKTLEVLPFMMSKRCRGSRRKMRCSTEVGLQLAGRVPCFSLFLSMISFC